MKATIYILAILLFVYEKSATKNILSLQNDSSIPYILDSQSIADKTFRTTEMQKAVNHVIYTGALTDTVNVNKYDRSTFTHYFLDQHEIEDSSVVKKSLKIYIPHKQILTFDLENFSSPPSPIYLNDTKNFAIDSSATEKALKKWKERPRNNVQSIPVCIHNTSNENTYLELQDAQIIMIQEAKDENGDWKPIEFWQHSWCGNSYAFEKLLPNTIVIAKIFKYDGDFETDIRLKLKNGNHIIYSDSFKGKINKSQFDLPSSLVKKFSGRSLYKSKQLDEIFLSK